MTKCIFSKVLVTYLYCTTGFFYSFTSLYKFWPRGGTLKYACRIYIITYCVFVVRRQVLVQMQQVKMIGMSNLSIVLS